MRNRELLCCVALLLAIAGCQGSDGTGGGAMSWWGQKESPPSNPNGSPFSAAATYNRQNTGDMGITLYDGSSHAKPSPPPANPPCVMPGASPAPPMSPGPAYPPSGPMYPSYGPNPGPGGGPSPGTVGSPPTGYWVYQPANGYPVANQNGVVPCIPVYGQPMNAYPGYGPVANGSPAMPPNTAGYPSPTSGYPVNYPSMAPANAATAAPVASNTPMLPYAAAGVQPVNAPGYGAPTIGNPQGYVPSPYAPGGFVPGSPATAGAPAPGNPGMIMPR